VRLLFGCTAILVCFASNAGAQLQPVTRELPLASPDIFASPAIDAGDYLYVSGQGPRRTDGSTPGNFGDQVHQSLENIRKVVEAAGLTMDHVVYVQVYLQDISRSAELNKIFVQYFPKDPPARAVLGVTRVPEPAVQISAVAVHDMREKHPVAPRNWKQNQGYSPGMLTHDRLFVSSMPGSNPSERIVPQDSAKQVDLALDNMTAVVEAAGLKMSNMVFVNPYLTHEIPMRVMNEHYAKRFEFGNTPARATIEVSSLPDGAHIAYTGVAVRDLSQRHAIRPKNMPPSPTASPCVFAGDTLYCSAKSGFIPGPNGGVYSASTADQTRQTMRNLLDNLEEADMTFDQVVSTTVYLDDLSELSAFEKIYKKYFHATPPAQTFVQQIPSGPRKPDDEGRYPDLEQASLIAVRSKPSH
jgi:enamine deaminase RidA (YjgF/YER057c/UK114 family)